MAVRHTGAAAFPEQGPPAQTGHFRGEASFVNAHHSLRIELGLEGEPLLPSFQDVLALLFQGMGGLFLNVHSYCRSQRIAVEIPTPNRAAIERADAPITPASRTRSRRSSLNALAITVSINENGESQDVFSVTSRFEVQ
ncbi:hypothetical protein AD935_00345 [Gluconobacter japonicus]|nr:hypothetical protein AD935_00345 [Gluconobacter japonicus]